MQLVVVWLLRVRPLAVLLLLPELVREPRTPWLLLGLGMEPMHHRWH